MLDTLRYARVPFRPTPLVLVACLSLTLMLAVRAGLAGLLLTVVSLSWFFKYCFVLLDAVIAGEHEPPVLSVEHVNPLNEQRPLGEMVLIAFAFLLLRALTAWAGGAVGVLLGTALLAALPASIAVMGLTWNPLRAAWPPELWSIARGLGRDYLALVLGMLASGAALYALWRLAAPLGVTLALSQLILLVFFALIGGAVHENRAMLGLATLTRAERAADRDAREHRAERARALDRCYEQVRLGRLADGWRELERWIARQGESESEYEALAEMTARWDQAVPIADRVVGSYLAFLLQTGETGRALVVCERRLAQNPDFRPKERVQAVRLAELAGLAGKRALQRKLVAATTPALPSSGPASSP